MVMQGLMGKSKKTIMMDHFFFFLHLPESLQKIFHVIRVILLKHF